MDYNANAMGRMCRPWFKLILGLVYLTYTQEKKKNATSKIWNSRFYKVFMRLIFIFKAACITRFPSVLSLCLVCDVTCCVIFIKRFCLLMHNF